MRVPYECQTAMILRLFRPIDRVYISLIFSVFLVWETTFMAYLNQILIAVIVGISKATGMFIVPER